MTLTTIVPTKNEEVDLPRTLESLQGLGGQIIVVDSGSTDRTLKIATQYGARTIHHDFSSFAETRNFGDSLVDSDWILSLEADVVISSELAKEIKNVISQSQYKAYKIGRQNIIWGKKINHTDWGPQDDSHIWLYRKGSGNWQGGVHEEYISSEPVGKLKNHLIHYNYRTISEFIEKINRYSDLASSKSISFPFWWGIRDFFKRYFYKFGFLDGLHGLFLSYLQAVYYLTLYVKNKTRPS